MAAAVDMMPSPSAEQSSALSVWHAGGNQVCSAAAGSGKTTLLLHACAQSSEPVVVLTYNKQLEIDMSSRLRELGLSSTHKCFTFHGACSHFFRMTPDDESMHAVLDEAEAGTLCPQRPFEFRRICIDEAQDMKRVFFRLICQLAHLDASQWLLVGDELQMLNDYDPSDPAVLDFMRQPQTFFGGSGWTRTRLSVSFRLTAPVGEFANALLDHGDEIAPGNALSPPLPVRVYTMSSWRWADLILPWITGLREHRPDARIFLLVPKKKGNVPLRHLVNALSRRGVPIYIHGHDSQDIRVQQHRVVITTWHASKGMQCDAAAVLGVDAESQHNPLHVAVTRSKTQLLVVQSQEAPHPKLTLAAAARCPNVVADPKTAEVARAADDEDGELPDAPHAPLSNVHDLTHWAPRGRCTELHQNIVDAGSERRFEAIDIPTVEQVGQGKWADVSELYKRAAMLECEFRRTGACRFLEFMLHPKRASKEQQATQLARSGTSQDLHLELDHAHVLDTRVQPDDLLPRFAYDALREAAYGAMDARDWMTVAVCAESWNSYHHNLRALLPCRWADPTLQHELVMRLLRFLPPDAQFDTRLVHSDPTGDFTLHTRCAACTDSLTVLVSCDEQASRSTRLSASLPLALHRTAERAALLNLRSGDVQWCRLASRPVAVSGIHQALMR